MKMTSYSSFKTWLKAGVVLSLFVGLSACSFLDGVPSNLNASNIPDAVPKAEPLSKYGNKASYVVGGKRYYVMKSAKGYDKVGNASWYGTKFHGQRTSSQEPYNMYAMTAASTVLPIPSYVRVTNLQNGRSAIVRVNDRGPFHSSRIIDLSYAAAKKLGYTGQGTAKVRVTAIDVSSPSSDTFFAQNDVSIPQVTQASKVTAKQVVPIKSNVQLAQNYSPVYLQVGAFHTRNTAEKVSKKITRLTKLNHTQVAVKEGVSSGSRVYRVHIGPLQDTAKSKQVAQLLAENGYEKTVVITG